jgi:hypothetical protein
VQPSEGPSSRISRWIDHFMDSIFFKADHLHFTLAKRNSPSETVVKTHRQMGTSSTLAETSPTACSLFGAVMRQFEFNSRRIPIEKASPGAAPLDLQMSEKDIRLSGLSLFMAVEAEHVLKTSLDFGLLSSSVPSDQLLADPVDVSIAFLLPPIMQVVMQPGLRYMAMRKLGLSIRIESDVLATCKSSHIAQFSALLHNILLYKVCLSVCLSVSCEHHDVSALTPASSLFFLFTTSLYGFSLVGFEL